MAGERILFVDDEEALVELWQTLLSRLGYRVTGCTEPKEALRRFAEDPNAFDLVITDITMPELPGDVLAAEVLKLRPEIPVVLCTGYHAHQPPGWTPPHGVSGFLAKPFPVGEAASLIRTLLDGA